jgi:hypothetical protein
METPDATRAKAAARGERNAFGALFARHQDRLCWRLTGDRAEAWFATWLYRATAPAAATQAPAP